MNIKEKLLKEATKLFVEKGFHATSIREIASNANVNSSMISYYFKNKVGLYQALIKSRRQKLEEKVEKANLEKLSPNKRLIKFFEIMNSEKDANIAIITLRAILETKEKGIQEIIDKTLFSYIIEKLYKFSSESKINKKYEELMDNNHLAIFILINLAGKLIATIPNLIAETKLKEKIDFIPKEFDTITHGILKELLNENNLKPTSN